MGVKHRCRRAPPATALLDEYQHAVKTGVPPAVAVRADALSR
ncbi:MAG TPA: hypothetical protein VIW27_04090 [Gammaproteobacteria bacterium]|jgi:hypothetical protein